MAVTDVPTGASARKSAVIAVDAGTTAVKAAAIEPDGGIAVVESRPVERRYPGMIDPERFWRTVADAIAAVVDQAGQIDAIVITGQGDGLWAIDAEGQPVSKALEWSSQLGAAQVDEWSRDGTIEAHFRESGTVLWAGSTAPLWRWTATNRPDLAERVDTVFWAKDWVNFRLSGERATDVTDASIPFLEQGTNTYSAAAFERLQCPELHPKMAPIRPAGSRLGSVTAGAAVHTGVTEGTPVILGCMDTTSLVHGAGLSTPGDALAVLGTTAAVMAVRSESDSAGDPMGATLTMNRPGLFLRHAGATSGTSTLDWFLDTFGYTSGPEGLRQLWQEIETAGPGVMMLPHLAGERAPFLAPHATGAFSGITPRTTRADIARSVVMAITMSLRHNLEVAGTAAHSALVLSGGGAASPEWSQLVADVLGRPVAVDDRPHIATVGVAALALGEELPRHERVVYHPQRAFDDEFDQYLALQAALRPTWSHRAETASESAGGDASWLDLD